MIQADCGQMPRWITGLASFSALLAQGHARLLGPSRLTLAFPGWFDTAFFADGLRRAEKGRAAPARQTGVDAVA